ncbi:MAG TPA: hypothetical protein VJ608_07425 [Albitalea sp.]|nr:hypothetical protein [Albitalea sp.]
MKHIRLALAPLALCATAPLAQAVEYGTVVSTSPVTAQVPVTRRSCSDEQVAVAQRPSGAGALFGALVGGAIGNSVGAGMGRAAATGLGVITGAAIGDRAEAESIPPATTTVRRCGVATRYEDRLMGYDVVYEHAGSQHTARMAQDPGPAGTRIALEVAPVGATRPGRVGTAVPPASRREPAYYDDAEPVVRSDDGYGYAAPAYYAPPPAYYVPPPAVYYGGYGGYGYAGPVIWIGGTYRYHHRRH